MKSLVANLWQRRWCRFLGVGLILCVLPLLHPFFRQSLFGPTHEGIPLCIWEEQIRQHAQRFEQRSWSYRVLEKLGLVGWDRGSFPRGKSSVPLHLHFADDVDVKVRRFAVAELAQWVRSDEASIVPVLRGRLNDSDLECRAIAARGILTVEQDAALFEPMAKLAEEKDRFVRGMGVAAMGHFGKRGLSIVRSGLADADKGVRLCAISAAANLGADGADLIPDLLPLQGDLDPTTRREAALALTKIDPKRFPPPDQELQAP